MAIISAGTYLGYRALSGNSLAGSSSLASQVLSSTSPYTRIDIKSVPEIGSAPERIETTTLSNLTQRTYIPGLKDSGEFAFTSNYSRTEYLAIQGLDRTKTYSIVLVLSDGSVLYWEGLPMVFINGAEVNGLVEMTINIIAETEVVMVQGVKGGLSGDTLSIVSDSTL